MPELANPPATDVDRQVAALIAAEIEDGACLQIGIGGMPNAVCALLKDAGIRDLGIHTEMFVDGMVDLIEAGVVTGARKQIDRYESVFTFAAGSRRTYDFLDRHPQVQSHSVDYTNLPRHHRAQRPRRRRSTTRRRSTCRARRPRSRTASATSPAPAGSCSSCAAPTPRAAARRSSASPPPTSERGERAQPHRHRPDPGQHRHHAAHRRDVRRHRVRPGQPEGQVGRRARARRSSASRTPTSANR